MFESCLEKQEAVRKQFEDCQTPEERYQRIIEFGKRNQELVEDAKTPSNRVMGCQSQMFLLSKLEDGVMRYQAESDALISNGLAVLLISVYDGEKPEVVLKCPPQYLKDLEVTSSLSPGRANGLASLFQKMQQDAVKCYAAAMKDNAL